MVRVPRPMDLTPLQDIARQDSSKSGLGSGHQDLNEKQMKQNLSAFPDPAKRIIYLERFWKLTSYCHFNLQRGYCSKQTILANSTWAELTMASGKSMLPNQPCLLACLWPLESGSVPPGRYIETRPGSESCTDEFHTPKSSTLSCDAPFLGALTPRLMHCLKHAMSWYLIVSIHFMSDLWRMGTSTPGRLVTSRCHVHVMCLHASQGMTIQCRGGVP